MAKAKKQKEQDLAELTQKLKEAKAAVFIGYTGTTVKDIDTFRKTLSKEGVFSKVYKLTLVKKAMKEAGITGEIADYKTPVILSVSKEDETVAARVIKNLSKDIKSLNILEGLMDGALVSKAQVETLGSLPSKDQLRAQLLSVFNGPIAALARLLDAYGKKKGEGSLAVETAAAAPAPEPSAPAAA